jgi:hypothetical protein
MRGAAAERAPRMCDGMSDRLPSSTPDIPLVLHPEVYAAARARVDDLLSHTYVAVDGWSGHRTGLAVNARSHRYPEALERGIGVVLTVLHRARSPWSMTYGAPDVEFVILRWDGQQISQLANYHCEHVTGPFEWPVSA